MYATYSALRELYLNYIYRIQGPEGTPALLYVYRIQGPEGTPCRIPGGCFTNVSRALQDFLSKFAYCRNRTSYENFKLKLCTCAQSHALGTHANFQLEILTVRPGILTVGPGIYHPKFKIL